MLIALVLICIAAFVALLVSVIRQEKKSEYTPTPIEWEDTFGGPVDWDKH